MTNIILLFYAGLFAATLWVLAAVVNRWDEDHHKLNAVYKKMDEHVRQLKGLEEDLDDLYSRFYQLRDWADGKVGDLNANDEAAAKAILNIKNDISKLSIKLHKLEGKENNNE